MCSGSPFSAICCVCDCTIQAGDTSDPYLFVATLGATNYSFVRLYPSMDLKNWIQAHCVAFEFFGGIPAIVVPDNLKTVVTKPNYYDPDINPTYADMARHYGVVVLPARIRKPNDKAKVESAVLHVERKILAALRDHTFFSIEEANEAIAEKLEGMNNEPFQKLVYYDLKRPLSRRNKATKTV